MSPADDLPSAQAENRARYAMMTLCLAVIVLWVAALAISQHELYVRCERVGGHVETIGRATACFTRDGRLVSNEDLEKQGR